MVNTFRFVIHTVSPIHIGCDEVYEPLGFRLDEANREIVAFSPTDLVAMLPTHKLNQFSAICEKGTVASLLEIYKFMGNVEMEGRRIKVSPGFAEHYSKTLSIPLNDERKIQRELNQFTIWRTAFLTEDQRPYIPGSAIKGSLRTAYLNALAKEKKLTPFKARDAKRLEKILLEGGQFSTDPFRCIKVSDFRPVGRIKTKIVYAVNEKKAVSRFRARGPFQILEVIEPGNVFEGYITVEQPHPKAGIKNPISMETLLNSLKYFYEKERKREENQLSQIGVQSVSHSPNGSGVLIRLGRHSGAESVTIKGHRSIKIMGKPGEKPKWAKEATTLWLASHSARPTDKGGLQPFGWAALIAPDSELLEGLQEREKLWKKERRRNKADATQEAARQQQKEIERTRELERLRAEEEQRGREEGEKKAAWERLSPEDRAIAKVRDPATSEQEVVGIYNRIDQFPEAKKKELAQALKEYWVGKGKWKGKLSDKQKKKVKKIKEILE